MQITFVKGPIDREVREVDPSKYHQGGAIFVLDPEGTVNPIAISDHEKIAIKQHKYMMANTPEGVVAIYQGEVV